MISPRNEKIILNKVFDTYKSSEELDSFISSSANQLSYIIIVACMDECTQNLS